MHLLLACLIPLLSILTGYGATAATPAASSNSAPAGGGVGFRLIHRDSIHSPSYPGNLTAYELLARRVNYARARAQQMHYELLGDAVAPNVDLAPIVTHDEGGREYMAQILIGSDEVTQYLQIDTGSNLVWVQCEPYQGSHFNQDPPHYRIGTSNTFSYVPCSDKTMCLNSFTCDAAQQRCHPFVRYGDGTWAEGALSRETFHFETENDDFDTTPVDNIAFGCMYTASPSVFSSPIIAGIVGMGRGALSLAMQLSSNPNLDMPQFTYCLVPSNVMIPSHLMFGKDFTINGGKAQTLEFSENHILTSPFYYLNVVEISCNAERLNIPWNTFAIGGDGIGGTIIDSGASLTSVVQPAYDALVAYLTKYFAGSAKYRRVNGPQGNLLCYSLGDGPSLPLPSMTYHFGAGGELTVDPDKMWTNLTIDSAPSICLGIMSNKRYTIIGSNQQTNMRFVYDMKAGTLTFGAEDCRGH